MMQLAKIEQSAAEPHPDAARIVAEVAARYGLPVMAGARVVKVPRGVSGVPLPVFDGRTLVSGLSRAETVAGMKRQFCRERRLAGPAVPREPQPQIADRRQRIADLHANGATVAQMMAALVLTETQVRQQLRALGLSAHRPKPPVPATPPHVAERRAQIRALRDAGMGGHAIARDLGLSPKTVHDDLVRMGLAGRNATVAIPRQPQKRKGARAARLARLIEGLGFGLAGEALRLHVGVSTVGALTGIARAGGVTLPGGSPAPDRDSATVLALWRDGLTVSGIARHLAAGGAPNRKRVRALLLAEGVGQDDIHARGRIKTGGGDAV